MKKVVKILIAILAIGSFAFADVVVWVNDELRECRVGTFQEFKSVVLQETADRQQLTIELVNEDDVWVIKPKTSQEFFLTSGKKVKVTTKVVQSCQQWRDQEVDRRITAIEKKQGVIEKRLEAVEKCCKKRHYRKKKVHHRKVHRKRKVRSKKRTTCKVRVRRHHTPTVFNWDSGGGGGGGSTSTGASCAGDGGRQ